VAERLEPAQRRGVELVGGDARVRVEQHRGHLPLPARRGRGREVAAQQRLHHRPRREFRVGGGLLAQPREDEQRLDVGRLLAPERAVVVEDGDPLRRGDVLRPALLRDPREVAEDRVAGGPVVPGGQAH
jgi:hypothetical protein